MEENFYILVKIKNRMMARIELATARQQDCAITIEILIILQMSITIQAFS